MASVLIGNSCQTQTLQGLWRMGVQMSYAMTSSYKFHVTWVASQCSQWNASGTAFLEMLILLMEMLDISSMFKFR